LKETLDDETYGNLLDVWVDRNCGNLLLAGKLDGWKIPGQRASCRETILKLMTRNAQLKATS
jgi:hypothetical protein